MCKCNILKLHLTFTPYITTVCHFQTQEVTSLEDVLLFGRDGCSEFGSSLYAISKVLIFKLSKSFELSNTGVTVQ